MNVFPLSSDLHNSPDSVSTPFKGTPSPVSISAYNLSGLAGVIARAILPTSFLGKPLPFNFIQLLPPSTDLNIPPPGPPLTLLQVLRSICHAPAKRILELSGSITMSEIPVL